MKTRELTPAERQQLDAAHNQYVEATSDAANNRQAIERAGAAWRQYCEYMERNGIVATLAGYRMKVSG